MAIPIGATPKLYACESKRFFKKMIAAQKSTAHYTETPKLEEVEDIIRESGKVWGKETQ